MTIGKLIPRRRGRPFADPDGPKSVSVTFRVRPELKKQLEEMANTTGRSLSAEIEATLELAMDPGGNVAKYLDTTFEATKKNYAQQFKAQQKSLEESMQSEIERISKEAKDKITDEIRKIEQEFNLIKSSASI